MRRYPVAHPNKPPLGIEVNRSTAFERGLKAGFLLSEFAGSSTFDVVSKRRTGAFTGAPIWLGGRVGAVVRTTATTDTIPLLSNDLILPLTNCTIVIALYKTDSTLRPCFHLGTASGLSSVECGMAIPYNDGKVYFDWGANRTEGTSRLSVAQTFTPMQRDVFAFSTGTRGMRIYRNGRLIASNTANPQRTSNTQVVTL